MKGLRYLGDDANETNARLGAWSWKRPRQPSMLLPKLETSPGPHSNFLTPQPRRMVPPPDSPLCQTLEDKASGLGDARNWFSPPHPASSFAASLPMLSTGHSMPMAIPTERFLSYVRLFFDRMSPMNPILDPDVYLDAMLYTPGSAIDRSLYVLLCALSAVTVAQLDASVGPLRPLDRSGLKGSWFVEECLRTREASKNIATTSTFPIMTAFFLSGYYSNHERHNEAWFFLQESITLADMMDMGDEASYARLAPNEARWRRRLYWLLFITERGYAIQRRKRTRLQTSIALPVPLEDGHAQLLDGFVMLARLFSAVNDSFINVWRGVRKDSICNETWIKEMQRTLDDAATALDTVSETQLINISVTCDWLHVLVWQLGVSHGLIRNQGKGCLRLDYPVALARKVVAITTRVNALSLDCHGLGMEQKLHDIANCLVDVLKCAGHTSPMFQHGKDYLNVLLARLSSIRGKESRYREPLLHKMEGLMGTSLDPMMALAPGRVASSPLSATVPASSGLSFTQSGISMLRSLSMSGGMGATGPVLMPPNAGSYEPSSSGWSYDEEEAEAMIQAWEQNLESV